MATRSYDRIDFYKRNRDYSSLLDEDTGIKETKKEVSKNEKSAPYKTSERHGHVDRRAKLKALEQQKLKQRFTEIYGHKEETLKQDNCSQKRKLEETTTERQKKRILQNDNFGSFFGPSEPVIAKRVIEQSRSKLESAHIGAKLSKDNTQNSKAPALTGKSESRRLSAPGAKPGLKQPFTSNSKKPIITSEVRKKAQLLKEARDYSFLASKNREAQLPATSRNGLPASHSDNVRSARVGSKPSEPTRKPILVTKANPHAKEASNKVMTKQPVAKGIQKTPASNTRSSRISVDPNKKLPKVASNEGRAASLPSNAKIDRLSGLGEKRKAPLPSNIRSDKLQPRPSSLNGPANHAKSVSVSSRAAVADKRKPIGTTNLLPPKPISKVASQTTTSKIPSKPVPRPANASLRPIASSRSPANGAATRPTNTATAGARATNTAAARPLNAAPKSQAKPSVSKKRPSLPDSEEDFDYRSIIRKMFGYDPTKYRGMDDDDRGMVSGFTTIQREERASARIAREEDERELELIEKEEREERERAKRRRLMKMRS